MDNPDKNSRDRAVVLGAGMAGLLAARVLAEHYAEVVIIERDRLPNGVADRTGVTQGRHSHVLLARGQIVLESLFPSITDELAKAGARVGDVVNDTRLYFSGHRLKPAPSDLTMISSSRAFLETHVRARVRALTNVQMLERCDAVGLRFGPRPQRVTGIRLLRREDGSAEETLDTDLVVDTSGRNSRVGAWLDGAGCGEVLEERVIVDIAYATCRYRMGADALGGDLAIVNAPIPANPRGGALALIEGDQAMLTLAGVLGDRPPLDPGGFLAFAGSLQLPDIRRAVADAEPIDDPVPHRFPASTWRHYERMKQLPDGLAVLGDATCSFNPIYGQGMAVAALEAEVLRQHLEQNASLNTRRLHRDLAKVLRPPWLMATGADLQFPGVEGRRTMAQRQMSRYVTRLHAAASRDATLSRVFMGVSGLVDPPQALLRPSVVKRVLRPRPARSGAETSPILDDQQSLSEAPTPVQGTDDEWD